MFEGVDLEQVGLGVKELPGSYGLVGVEGVFLSKLCEWELILVTGNPVIQCRTWDLDFMSAAHCSLCHADCMALVVVGEC